MKAWKIVKRILFVLLSLIAAIVLAGFIIIRYYEDEVVAYALGEIQKGLVTDMHIADADLSFWNTFPHASIRFTDLYIQETAEEKDTLVYAAELNLGFSLGDLFSGDYNVRDIYASDAVIRLKLDEKGNDNWHFWKPTGDTSAVAWSLEDVTLRQVHFVYEDRSRKQYIELSSRDCDADGTITEAITDFELDFDGELISIISGDDEWVSGREVELEGGIRLNLDEGSVYVSETRVETNDVSGEISGLYRYGDKPFVDLQWVSRNLDLERVRRVLPPSSAKTLGDYALEGDITLNASVKGEITEKKSPVVDVSFLLSKGNIEHRSSGTSLSAIEADARFHRDEKGNDRLTISSMNAGLGGGRFAVTGVVDHLSSPHLDLTIQAQADLGDVKDFFGLDTLDVCSGMLQANATATGKLVYRDDDRLDWSAIKLDGKAELTDAHFSLKQSDRTLAGIRGVFLLSGGNASVQELSGQLAGSSFTISGTLSNLIPYLTTEDQVLSIQASFFSPSFDLGPFVTGSDNQAHTGDDSFRLPDRVNCSFNADIQQLIFRKFSAQKVKGVVKVNAMGIEADPISFTTAKGDILSQVRIQHNADGNYNVLCLADLNRIDIRELFTEFGNFGQSFLRDDHLQGKATSRVQFSAVMTPSLDLKDETVESLIDITIENGQLTGLQSLQGIADYIRNNAWAAPFVNEDKFAEKLKDVKFSKLENVIEIRNKQILIPFMEVKTSAMDISVRGTHGFDSRIDYTIGFSLRDILIRKEKDWEEVDDGLGKQMYVYMKGTTTSPEFGLDKKAAKEKRQEEMAAEKQNVKALLKEEFGLFRNDASVGTYQEKVVQPQSTVTIEWDENAPPPTADPAISKPKDIPPPPGKTRKVPKWLQEKHEEEKEN